jgi:hypothetical protein
MLDVPLIALPHERDELPHGVVELARLRAAKLFVLLVHQPPHFAF